MKDGAENYIIMGSLIETFHIDVKLIIAQIINFAIVFSVLYWLAFKPLAKVMAERSGKIEKSLLDAKKIEEKLSQAKEEFNKTVSTILKLIENKRSQLSQKAI